MQNCGIYLLTSPSGKQYVGQSNNIKHRITYYDKHIYNSNRPIDKAILKYGFENFNIEYLFIGDYNYLKQSFLDNLEKYYINYYKTLTPNGYNISEGGKQNVIVSENTKNKISKTLKRKFEEGLENGNSKPIYLIINNEIITEYKSIMDASRDLNKCPTSITNILNGRASKTKEGYSFKYKIMEE